MQVEITEANAKDLINLLTFIEASYGSIVVLIEWDQDRRKGYLYKEVLEYDDVIRYATNDKKLKENQEIKQIDFDELTRPFNDFIDDLGTALKEGKF